MNRAHGHAAAETDRKSKRRSPQDASENQADRAITKREVEDIEERSTPRTPIIYEIVSRQGDEEMARPFVSLWWSGFGAGMSISFSLLASAILQVHLPRTLADTDRQSWLSCRLRHGGDVAAAAFHRDHRNRRAAGHRQ